MLLTHRGGVARVNPATGRTRWRVPMAEVHATTLVGGRYWVLSADPGRGREVLSALDPATGRVISRTVVADLGGMELIPAGRDLWLVTTGGTIVVMRPS